MKNYYFSTKFLVMALLGGGLSLASMLYSSAEGEEKRVHEFVNSLNQDNEVRNEHQENNPKIYQDAVLNLLEGIAALKYFYAQTEASSAKQYFIGSSSLNVTLNSDNTREILDATNAQAVKKLKEYESHLLELIKKIDDSHPDQPIIVPSLEKTLKVLWLEYANRISSENIKKATDYDSYKACFVSLVFSAIAPLITSIVFCNLSDKKTTGHYNHQNSSNKEFAIASLIVSLVPILATSMAGGLLGVRLSDSVVNPDEHKLESLTALSEQLEMVTSAEELFNAALVGQKRRELIRRKNVSEGGEGVVAVY